MLPVDHVMSPKIKGGAENEVRAKRFRTDQIGVDIGPKTIDAVRQGDRGREDGHLERSDGRLREAAVRCGTVALAKAVAESGATSVVGGGDSEKAIKSAGVTSKISHVSTGGGASLEFLSGIELPGVAALTEK